ncbi:hypothetical protein EON68_02420 [archaeon]|nr:MAG: hypothetical protein EON68_02420 [archaeon]
MDGNNERHAPIRDDELDVHGRRRRARRRSTSRSTSGSSARRASRERRDADERAPRQHARHDRRRDSPPSHAHARLYHARSGSRRVEEEPVWRHDKFGTLDDDEAAPPPQRSRAGLGAGPSSLPASPPRGEYDWISKAGGVAIFVNRKARDAEGGGR